MSRDTFPHQVLGHDEYKGGQCHGEMDGEEDDARSIRAVLGLVFQNFCRIEAWNIGDVVPVLWKVHSLRGSRLES